MNSTEFNVGLTNSARPSSRVLKPPGGGHTNIFSEPEVAVNAPRPRYNQQNSSNLNACMGSTDPNKVVEKMRDEIVHTKLTPDEPSTKEQTANAMAKSLTNEVAPSNGDAANGSRGRVPPGGYSSGGFW